MDEGIDHLEEAITHFRIARNHRDDGNRDWAYERLAMARAGANIAIAQELRALNDKLGEMQTTTGGLHVVTDDQL